MRRRTWIESSSHTEATQQSSAIAGISFNREVKPASIFAQGGPLDPWNAPDSNAGPPPSLPGYESFEWKLHFGAKRRVWPINKTDD